MSHEIVTVDPIDVPSTSYSRAILGLREDDSPERTTGHQFTRSLTFREHVSSEPFDSERLPATLASEIQRFLRIANLVESEEPRIAYLCRFHAFEIAHHMDRNSTGRGVRQFKTSLLRRLEQDEEFTESRRKEEDDTKELKRVYDAYTEYIIRHGAAFNLDNSQQKEKFINAHRIASVLYEVLKANDTSGAYASAPLDMETGELLDMVTLTEETHKRNLETSVNENTELIVQKCKPLEEERQTHMSQGDDSVQSNHLTKTEIDAIYKEEVQIKKDRRFAYGSMEHDCRPSSAIPSLFDEDKYLETQEKLNKLGGE